MRTVPSALDRIRMAPRNPPPVRLFPLEVSTSRKKQTFSPLKYHYSSPAS